MLAGGSGRRLGQVDKPALTLAGRSLLDIALAAVAPAATVVVGPGRTLPAGVIATRENPPGGGPAAALVAGLAVLDRPGDQDVPLVAVFAADLPGIGSALVDALSAALVAQSADGAVLTDPDGRRQYLAGVWRLDALTAAAAARDSWHGRRVSELLDPLIGATVEVDRATAADVDTDADLVEWKITPPTGRNRD